ncbi:MAG: hypothetical protein ABIH21_02570 [Patescibacteria group bacterium]
MAEQQQGIDHHEQLKGVFADVDKTGDVLGQMSLHEQMETERIQHAYEAGLGMDAGWGEIENAMKVPHQELEAKVQDGKKRLRTDLGLEENAKEHEVLVALLGKMRQEIQQVN